MNEWRDVTLSDLASPVDHALATGPFGSSISSKYFVDNGVPVIRGSNLSTDVGVRLNDKGLVFLTSEKADTFRRSTATTGDLVFTSWGTIGQVGLIDDRSQYESYIVSNKQMKLTPDPSKVLSLFLYFALSTADSIAQVKGQSIGAAVPGFNLGQLREVRVRIPDLSHQKQIVDVLGSIDDLIENNRRRVEVLEEMARAIYREWFVHFRFPGHENTTFVDSDLGLIPEGWHVRRLDSVADINKESRTPGHDEEIRYLDISSMGDRHFDAPSPTAGKDAPGRARRVVHPGDVVWSMVRPNRRSHTLLIDPGTNWIASTGSAVISASNVTATYLFEVTSDRRFSDYLVSHQRGAAYPAVKVADFKSAPICVPDDATLQKFTESVEPLHHLSWTLRSSNLKTSAVRDLLLPKLVTGQIDVSDLDLDAMVEQAGV